VRRRDSASPFVTTDSKTSSSIENRAETQPSSANESMPRQKRRARDGYTSTSGYGSASSPVVYWSEFENQTEEPYTVSVDETTSLLPWFQSRNPASDGSDIGVVAALRKIRGAVESEVKTSANGLTTLFYEKDLLSDEESGSEDSSSFNDRRYPIIHAPQRMALLNRGYALCVVGCTMLLSSFGIVGMLLNGEAIGIGAVLVGFLISMTLEIVSLVRFIMQGGYHAVAWIGFCVVGFVGAGFIPLVALTGN